MRHKTFAIPLLCLLCTVSCGGGSSSDNNANATPIPAPEPPTTPVVEDIYCDSNYPVAFSNIRMSSDNGNIQRLIDKEKTDDSSWKPSNIDATLIGELSEPILLKHLVLTWQDTSYAHLYKVYASKDEENWQLINGSGQSEKNRLVPELIPISEGANDGITARFIKIELAGNELSEPSEILEIEAFGCSKDAVHSIELVDWYLSVPTDVDNNGKSDSIKEEDLAGGYFDPRFFSLSPDGGLIFSTSVSGYRTSTNTKYVRTELREMLRRGNTAHKTQGVNQNNWVFSSAPLSDQNLAGGIDGRLDAKLAVNKVTTTGVDYQIGRVIIGQIHANDDEPIRLYYRKLPQNSHGAIYLAHEPIGEDDIYLEIIGSRSNTASNPVDGIPLNEAFEYSINVDGNQLLATITKADGSTFQQSYDMSNSGYDQGGQYMYFKAGVYNQNNSGHQHDYVQATFYQIENSHTGY